jgi:hypothetical protein
MWLGKYLAYRAQPLTQLQLGNELLACATLSQWERDYANHLL